MQCKSLDDEDPLPDWFHHFFIPKVEEYLEEKGLPFKFLLVLDNAPGHPSDAQDYTNEDAEVVLLPPNTTSLIQLLKQGVIKAFKANYVKRHVDRIVEAMDSNDNLNIIQFWKDFTIADSLFLIKHTLQDIMAKSVNACWKNLQPEVVHDFSPDE